MTSLKFIGKRRSSLYNAPSPVSQVLFQKNSHNLPKLGIFAHSSTNSINENANIFPKEITKKPQKSSKSNKDPEVDNEVQKFISFSANRHFIDSEINIPPIPPLPSPNDPNFEKIFNEKIRICNIIFNFNKPKKQIEGKKVKLNALVEINKLLLKDSDISLITKQQKDMIFDMLMKNIFEQDPFISNDLANLSTLNPSIIEPSWEHMCHVYQALIQFFIIFPDRCQISHVKHIIRLLNIPDNNERENLMTLLQDYANSHKDQKEEIYKLLKSALVNVLCNIYTPYCVEPVLSFLKILVRKEYLSNILYTHLLPLYRHEKLYLYSSKLTNLVMKIIENRQSEHVRCVEYFLKHFPLRCGSKQCMFIYALNSLLDMMIGRELNKIAPKIISFFAYAVSSPNSRLADPATKILLKPAMTSLLYSNSELAIDSLQTPLKWSSVYHWDRLVKCYSGKALTTLSNISYEAQKKTSAKTSRPEGNQTNSAAFPSKNQYRHIDNSELISKWALIARCASKKDNSIDLTNSLLHIQASLLNEGLNNSSKI